MTFKILTDDTSKIISRSNIHPADDLLEPNLRLDSLGGEESKKFIKSRHDNLDQSESNCSNMPIVDPKDLIGRTFLQSKNEDGTRKRVKIVSRVTNRRLY